MSARFAVTVHQSTTYNGDDILAHTIIVIPPLNALRSGPLPTRWEADHVDPTETLIGIGQAIGDGAQLLLINTKTERASLYPSRDIHRIEIHT